MISSCNINEEDGIQYENVMDYFSESHILTLNAQLSLAKEFIKKKESTHNDLAHHLSDNIISKIFLFLVLKRKKEKYEEEKRGLQDNESKDEVNKKIKDLERRRWNFNEIIEAFRDLFYFIKVDYDNIKAEHEIRNVFQHNIKTIEFCVRDTNAECYVKHVESLMEQIGILRPEINLPVSTVNKNNMNEKERKLILILVKSLEKLKQRIVKENECIIVQYLDNSSTEDKIFESMVNKFCGSIRYFDENNTIIGDLIFCYENNSIDPFDRDSFSVIFPINNKNIRISYGPKILPPEKNSQIAILERISNEEKNFKIVYGKKQLLNKKIDNIEENYKLALECIDRVKSILENHL